MAAYQKLAVVAVLLGASACSRHVQLKAPYADPGEQFTCYPTTSQKENCKQRTNINPADDNKAHTAFIILPTACKGHYYEITIHDSDSSDPFANVTCAPAENVIAQPERVLPAPTAAPPATPPAPAPP
jgi:hypothetical protein